MTSRRALLTGALLALSAGLVGGCGGSTSHAQTVPTTSSVTAKPVASTPTAPTDLAGLSHELDQAGTELHGADGTISQTDPNAARAQEGSTP